MTLVTKIKNSKWLRLPRILYVAMIVDVTYLGADLAYRFVTGTFRMATVKEVVIAYISFAPAMAFFLFVGFGLLAISRKIMR